jgi:unsaturated rhamnogalacturonyl hydrolase
MRHPSSFNFFTVLLVLMSFVPGFAQVDKYAVARSSTKPDVKSETKINLKKEEELYSSKYIKTIMRKVHDWQVANPVSTNDKNINLWARAVFYVGMMAAYDTTKDKKYLDQAMSWANSREWKLGTRVRHADDHVPAQAYLEIYFRKKKPEFIAHTKEIMDQVMNDPKPGRKDWWWCDALFMAPPVLVRLYKATGDKKYLNFLHQMWWDTTEYLFDKEMSLYYRDDKFMGKSTRNGKKIFWSRGNGWVMGGTVRVLQFLPKSDPYYNKYVDLLKKMAVVIKSVQQEDGLWRPSLLDPEDVPYSEASGSAFFAYALAWGINNGHLDRKTYLPVVKKAWKGLTGLVNSDGKLGWVQPIGASPDEVKSDNYQEYGSGAFLLAGSEIYKLRLK